MIHNNFRKLMRMFSRSGSSGSTLPNISDFTDIEGYTGTTAETMFNRSVFSSTYCNLPVVSTAKTFDAIKTDVSYLYIFALIGNYVEGEGDYTIGNLFSDIKITSAVSKSYNMVLSTTILNDTNESKTFDEVGLFFHIGSSYYWHNQRYVNILLIKEKLSEPMTLGAGESISIGFNLFGDITLE